MADQSQIPASALHSFNHKPKTEYEAIISKFLLTFHPSSCTHWTKTFPHICVFYCILYLTEFPRSCTKSRATRLDTPF